MSPPGRLAHHGADIRSRRRHEVLALAHELLPRPSGANRYRARAIWRDGDGLNVSLDDSREGWYDFAADEGGGVLDLVQQVRGGTRQEALRWTANLAGIPLTDRPLTWVERERYRLQKAIAEREAADVVAWRDGLLKTLRHARDQYLSIYHVQRVTSSATGSMLPSGIWRRMPANTIYSLTSG
jgi:hypothetical protein